MTKFGTLLELFYELYNVSRLMFDFLSHVVGADNGEKIIKEFIINRITDDYAKEYLYKYRKTVLWSCLAALNDEQFKDFMEYLYEEEIDSLWDFCENYYNKQIKMDI